MSTTTRPELPPLPGSPELATLTEAIADGAAERQRLDQNPHEPMRLLRVAGIGRLNLPIEHGGVGASARELLSVVIELAAADPGVAHALRAHFWQVNELLRMPAGPKRELWLSRVRGGALLGNATAERGGRAGAQEYSTTLTRLDDEYVLHGSKAYSTGTLFADHVAVTADAGDGRVATALVPLRRTGVLARDDFDGIGQARTGTGTTDFDGVRVAESEIISLRDPRGNGRRAADDVALLQLHLHAVIAGILRNAVTDARDLLHRRGRTFAHATAAPADDPILHGIVGEIDATAYAVRAGVLTAADEVDAAYAAERAGAPDRALFTAASLAVSRVKVHADATALRAAGRVLELGGASAASRAANLDRHWRNIRTLTLHNPTAYKAVAVGASAVNDAALPDNGYF